MKSISNGGIYFHPIIIYIAGFSFFYIMPMIYHDDVNLTSIIIGTIGCSSFLIGWIFVSDSKVNLPITRCLSESKILYVAIFFLFLTSCYELFRPTEYSGYAAGYSGRSEGDIYFLIVSKFYDIAILICFSIFASKSKAKYLFIFLLATISELMSPTRLHFVMAVIYWSYFGVYFKFIRIRSWHAIIGFISLPFLFSFLLIKRLHSFAGDNFVTALFEIIVKIDIAYLIKISIDSLETFQTYLTSNLILEQNFIHPESGVFRFIYMAIPRSIWSDKPEPMARVIAQEFYPNAYSNGGGLIGGIFGDPFANGGIIAVSLIWIFLGYISRLTYNTTLRNIIPNDNTGNALKMTLYFVYIYYFVQCLRGFASDILWVYLYQTMIIFSIFYFIKVRASNAK